MGVAEDHHLGTVWAARTTCHYMQSARVCGIGAGKKWRGSTAVTYRNCLSLSFFFFFYPWWPFPYASRCILVVRPRRHLRTEIKATNCFTLVPKIPPSSPPTTEEENGRGGAHTHATKRESTRKKIRRQRTRGRETRYNNEKGEKK